MSRLLAKDAGTDPPLGRLDDQKRRFKSPDSQNMTEVRMMRCRGCLASYFHIGASLDSTARRLRGRLDEGDLQETAEAACKGIDGAFKHVWDGSDHRYVFAHEVSPGGVSISAFQLPAECKRLWEEKEDEVVAHHRERSAQVTSKGKLAAPPDPVKAVNMCTKTRACQLPAHAQITNEHIARGHHAGLKSAEANLDRAKKIVKEKEL